MPTIPSPLQEIEHPLFRKHNINVLVKRDDLIHPIISGNKWRKLKANIIEAKKVGNKGVMSFGGAYSNHIHALAYACKQEGLSSKAIIRGEPHYQNNYTLRWAAHWGMELIFVDRNTYRRRQDSDYIDELLKQHPGYHIVPEGGSNTLALVGVGDVMTELNAQADFDAMYLPVGSGGTLAGIIKADNEHHHIHGIAVLKQAEYLTTEIMNLLDNKLFNNWQLHTQYHGGGYAKFDQLSLQTLTEFVRDTRIPFEPVYSGKMLLAFLDRVKQGFIEAGSTTVLLHTGGLQGVGGLLERNRLSDAYITAIQSHLPSAPQVP
ncbi:1-aminocyclopropane-1-carboxylate deaminase/D-cysteine desulfhydrase [Thalassotalea euphylliae]|uniref:1-aminocyclopropane-1-carboxylate deaminase/D-cysteine desulfhydrase n=1 Tax=Thalassotalea euphylliae TaxID=1655234 RepID=UPI00362C0C47